MEFDRRSPVYEQLVHHFKEQIANGEFQPGMALPSRREIANTFKINPNTAQRAYKEMEEQKLIYTDGNSPSKITNDQQRIKELRLALISEALDQFIAVSKKLGLSYEEVKELMNKRYEEEIKHDRNL